MEYAYTVYFSYSFTKQEQSFDVYYDTVTYPFQEERYGQDDEDRQWDSGGMKFSPPKRQAKTSKKLPSIPVTAKRRNSIVDGTLSPYDDQFRPTSTPTGRRRMPQIPTRTSKHSLYDQDGLRSTPDQYSSPRGASLPPTPTKSTKIMSRLASQNLLSKSVPRAGRQLPKPNPKHRNLQDKRMNLMKRTSSAEYTENMADDIDNYYMRPGTMSAIENYNEDYNYAYQSNDNLPVQSDELFSVPVPTMSDSRSSVNANYLQSNGIGYEYQKDYYDDSITQNYNNQSSYDAKNTINQQVDVLDKREISPLTQQNTDSLESRDDELKDSFDTPVSSVNSSIQQLKPAPYYGYSTAGENGLTNTTPMMTNHLDVAQKNILNVSQYHGDQQQMKAIFSSSQPVITVAQVHNHMTTRTTQQRRQLKQQDSIDSTDFLQNQVASEKINNFIDAHNKYSVNSEAYLDTQESVESYVEEETEDTVTNGRLILFYLTLYLTSIELQMNKFGS